MAQLPPKIPNNMYPNWPNLAPFLTTPPPPPAPPRSQPSWVDEFLDFSFAKRGHRRRSVSDSIAFLEQPLAGEGGDFDRLGDDQLMCIFSDDVPSSSLSGAVPASSSSTPSDHNSMNDDKPAEQQSKNESEEAQSACKEAAGTDTAVDPKRVKRILANRQSAQRSRVRKLQYISELERRVTTLQTEVSALSPRIAFLDHQRSLLTLGNGHLKQRIAALAQDMIFKDAHQSALKKEIERLGQVYHQQNLNPSTSEQRRSCSADTKQ
ncbi:hypothetical protein OPV22_031454 [Ensete ventricosum]|uniref:BZIP domain-containing protein n=1 Tax=Ensete ventricosum TaxID=4639 RepID=A0AAV8PP58_ENSVE|nr:hypothetical protein OPV22_031454 [Ensete ventricosum]